MFIVLIIEEEFWIQLQFSCSDSGQIICVLLSNYFHSVERHKFTEMFALWRDFGLYLNANARCGNYKPLYWCIGTMGFFGGAFVEFAMIKWRPNGVNFCKANLNIFFRANAIHLASVILIFLCIYSVYS